MLKSKFYKRLAASLAGLALAAAAGTAAAAPTFQINPAVFAGPAGPVTADAIGGSTSELLQTVGNTHVGDGWLQYGTFRLASASLFPTTTGLLLNYAIYVTFHLEDVYVSGGSGINTVGSTYALTALTFDMWVDPALDNVFTGADAATVTAATVADVGGNDMLLGSGTLIAGTSSLNPLGGAALNANTTFALTALGETFFIDPVPFYSLTFNGFNNAGGGAVVNGQWLAINDASGTTTFAGEVPEPATVSLLGLGLLGLGLSRRRKS